jgi:hypothetical protein
MNPTRPKSKNCFNRLDYLVTEFLADFEEDGEAHMRERLRERYHPVEQMEEIYIDCLAMFDWRLQGCGIIQSGILQEAQRGASSRAAIEESNSAVRKAARRDPLCASSSEAQGARFSAPPDKGGTPLMKAARGARFARVPQKRKGRVFPRRQTKEELR